MPFSNVRHYRTTKIICLFVCLFRPTGNYKWETEKSELRSDFASLLSLFSHQKKRKLSISLHYLIERKTTLWKLPCGESGQSQHKEQRLQVQMLFSARTNQVPSNNDDTHAWSWHFRRINEPVVPVVRPICPALLMCLYLSLCCWIILILQKTVIVNDKIF